MKKAIIALIAVGVLAIGTVSYAHMWGGGPGYGGPMMGYGQGWGGPMMGYGPGWGGGPMMGYGPGYGYKSEEAKKFLGETTDLRKELNDKAFQYREAWRTGDEKKAEALEKEIGTLQGKLYEKAKAAGFTGGYGPGWGNHPCGGPFADR